ncbi:MAG: ATP-binding protein [Sphingobacteriia bacterium]|nr:ATP-binding protein [Sphingobacteriia bacterium]NCC41629.1 ATP-binding protein [Gammaproteobacteria bacterium]
MRSLEGRLQLGLAASLILLIGALWSLGHAALHRSADAFVLSRLEHDADALIGALDRDPDGRLLLGEQRLTPVYHQPYSGHYFVIDSPEGQRIRSRSLWDSDLLGRAVQPGKVAVWRDGGPLGQRLLIRGEGYRLDDGDLVLTVAEDVTNLEKDLVDLERLIASVALGGLILMLLVQRLILRRTFAALGLVYRDIGRLEDGQTVTLTERVPTEILPLVRKLNRLLVIFGQRLERSRTAAGNLGHAIKGPLSLLRQQLQDPALALDDSTRQTLIEQIERLHRLAERQLKRARLAGPGGVGLRFDPAAELPTLVQLLQRIHAPKSLDIQLAIDTSGSLGVDREDLLELLGNLLDNACKWADGRVRCRLFADGDELVMLIEDDGPGCSPTEIAAITGRGVRLDEEISGHGLGLAIANEIVAGYRGRISFARSPALGGLRAEVRLPLGDGQREDRSRINANP